MESYRELIQAVMKRSGISVEASLSTISLVIRAVGPQLSGDELAILKTKLVPELRQLLVSSLMAGRLGGAHNGREIIDSVSAALEISDIEAKARILSVLDELRAGISLWDDVAIFELIDHVRADVDQELVHAAVA